MGMLLENAADAAEPDAPDDLVALGPELPQDAVQVPDQPDADAPLSALERAEAELATASDKAAGMAADTASDIAADTADAEPEPKPDEPKPDEPKHDDGAVVMPLPPPPRGAKAGNRGSTAALPAQRATPSPPLPSQGAPAAATVARPQGRRVRPIVGILVGVAGGIAVLFGLETVRNAVGGSGVATAPDVGTLAEAQDPAAPVQSETPTTNVAAAIDDGDRAVSADQVAASGVSLDPTGTTAQALATAATGEAAALETINDATVPSDGSAQDNLQANTDMSAPPESGLLAGLPEFEAPVAEAPNIVIPAFDVTGLEVPVAERGNVDVPAAETPATDVPVVNDLVVDATKDVSDTVAVADAEVFAAAPNVQIDVLNARGSDLDVGLDPMPFPAPAAEGAQLIVSERISERPFAPDVETSEPREALAVLLNPTQVTVDGSVSVPPEAPRAPLEQVASATAGAVTVASANPPGRTRRRPAAVCCGTRRTGRPA